MGILDRLNAIAGGDIADLTADTFDGFVSGSRLAFIDFWADWCRPCHMLAPAVEEIAREYNGKLKVVKINVDENINTPGQYNVRGIPTLLLFKGGQVAEQIVGAVPKEHIEKALQRHLG